MFFTYRFECLDICLGSSLVCLLFVLTFDQDVHAAGADDQNGAKAIRKVHRLRKEHDRDDYRQGFPVVGGVEGWSRVVEENVKRRTLCLFPLPLRVTYRMEVTSVAAVAPK